MARITACAVTADPSLNRSTRSACGLFYNPMLLVAARTMVGSVVPVVTSLHGIRA